MAELKLVVGHRTIQVGRVNRCSSMLSRTGASAKTATYLLKPLDSFSHLNSGLDGANLPKMDLDCLPIL